jgi:cellulose synthase/poly-beta-1,6-N-acetylglucosamine synthase-like glycosyltransferase
MLITMKIVFWILFIIIIYIYIGYPLTLVLIAKLKKGKFAQKKQIFPKVSLIIAAYNEEKIVKERIENILLLNYPKEKLEVIIISDASSDRTDEIIYGYKDKGIILIRQPRRMGKMAALNNGVSKSTGEILVFSDADIFFKKDDIEKLVYNFADSLVGCVVGIKKILCDDKYLTATEGIYWKYELFLKKLEGEIGSVAAGASGCNFAMRKELYLPLEEKTTAEDLILPLICISQGYRVVFEPEAVSYEKLLPRFEDEFKRKIRIVMGGLHALSLVKDKFHLIDKVTLFELFIHKILRWYASFLLLGLFVVNCFLQKNFYFYFLYLQIAFYSLAIIGFICLAIKIKVRCWLGKVLDIPLYFVTMNLAALIGILKYSFGMHQGWNSYKKLSQE